MSQDSSGPAPAGERPPSVAPNGARRVEIRVPAIFAAMAVPWIVFSDAVLGGIFPSVEDLTRWSTVKGIAFVAVMTGVIHVGIRWLTRRERRATEALRIAERRYEVLADNTRDVILFIRPGDGRILEANVAAVAAYGWSREELGRMTILDLDTSGASGATVARVSAAHSAGIRFETLHRRRDGTVFPVEITSQRAVVGGETVLVEVVRDATERRAAEDVLRESEERLSLAIEGAGLGIFHAIPYGPLEWSPRCREIFGVDSPSLPDFEAFVALIHPEDRLAVRAAAARWTDPRGDGTYQQQYRIVRPDGAVRWVSAHGKARFAPADGERRPVRLAGTVLDITDIKAVQAQLMQSDRLASVGMIAAGVAHEINNPLAYLGAALEFLAEHTDELMARSPVRDEVLQALADARRGAERACSVVRDLRTFSGLREERRRRVELEPILESAIHVAMNEIRYRARLEREYGPAPAVVADEARLGQVALNLLINAAQAIPEGRLQEHEIRVVTATDALGRAVFEVRDTGTGIPDEIVDRIFDPFFTTKPPGVGTGLGLSICRDIVAALGGELGVVRPASRGTTMRVSLPAAPAAPAAGAVAARPPPPAATGKRGRVLVVDDEPAVASALRRVLSPQHEVAVCGSAEEAIEAIGRGERFDAILCDLMMPGMTGMDLHEALARDAPDQASRMIVLTGGAFTDRSREFLARVPLPVCEKPFDSGALREIVRNVVGWDGPGLPTHGGPTPGSRA